MTGTVIHVGAVLVGGTAGTLLGSRLPERVRGTVMAGLGLVTLVIGFHMTLKTHEILIVLISVLLGGIVGELARIEDGLQFHIEVTPRMAKWAGFELGSGIIINSVGPEDSAKFYRGELSSKA